MDILNESYQKTTTANQRNLQFWDNYLQSLKSLDFNVYSDKLTVPILVPIGSKILFRGELKHTNEVTVALGADYFVKCSLKQADILKQHRIKVAQKNVDAYNKEKKYLEDQMSFTKKNIYDNQGEEIIEYYTEEEDKLWRQKHKDNVKEYMQKRGKQEEESPHQDENTDTELWERLDELELQEELENELNSVDNDRLSENIKKPFVVKEEDCINFKETKANFEFKQDKLKSKKEIENKSIAYKETNIEEPSKLDLLQQVIDRQNELGEKLHELKTIETSHSKTEQDLISKLDKMEQLDELEDEMDRLDAIIENENISESGEEEEWSKSDKAKVQRKVSFIDEDDTETLNIAFKHSTVEPNNEPYDPDKGIQKPSDIYKAYSSHFAVTSILKKSKYAKSTEVADIVTESSRINAEKEARKFIVSSTQYPTIESLEEDTHKTIVVKDVVENVKPECNKLESETKPMSLFKKKRMQNKS